jgi:GNAT superfamily N-acetyltransferase
MASRLHVAPATAEDVPTILRMARGLADYERMPQAVTATEEDLRRTLFAEPRRAEAAIGYLDGQPAGMVVFFHNYSTFLGRPGIYLEDIFVEPQSRGLGLGQALMQYVARLAVERGCARFEWAVLNWNEPAIGFYEQLGARPQSDWTVYRLTGDALQRLAEGAPPEHGA